MLKRRAMAAVRLVLPFDPAVIGGWDAYRAAGYDESKLQLADGSKPTKFVIEPLTRRQRNLVDRFDGRQRLEVIVQCGLRSVLDYYVVNGSGDEVELRQPEREQNASVPELGALVSEKWLDEANLLDAEVEAIAAAVLDVSNARPT